MFCAFNCVKFRGVSKVILDQKLLQRHLEEAERFVRRGAAIVDNQRRLVAKLEMGGHNVNEAKKWLSKFENILDSFLQHRAMILREAQL
jgi:hypothetical protein